MDLLHHIFAFDPQSPLLFTQFYFWAFLCIVYCLFALFAPTHKEQQTRIHLRNIYLCLVSWFFYYKTSGTFLLILLFITCSDWLLAQLIAGGKRRWPLLVSVLIDLGILCYFKYAYFSADLLSALFGTQLTITEKIILPVGISFYIFQVISYTADVYRGDVKPVRNILDFGFYVSFFPQLVAGPIVRAKEFIPQLYKPFSLSRRWAGMAAFWIVNGLAKKIILSDYLAVNFIDRVFENPMLFSGFENLMALFTYSLQVYADFSGYTDIAIGVAMLFGFYLPKNFDSPYKSLNAQEFWRRWHMSLSRWLKSYLYIPLGGNRKATFGTWFFIGLFALIGTVLSGSRIVAAAVLTLGAIIAIVIWRCPSLRKLMYSNLNSFITMLLGGLWHGASWNFIIWGGLNGIGMIVNKCWREAKNRLGVTRWIEARPTLLRLDNAVSILLTFVFISFTRLFFRASSNLDPATANAEAWQTARQMLGQMANAWNNAVIPDVCAAYWKVFTLFLLGMLIHWLPERWKRSYRMRFALMPVPAMLVLITGIVFVLYQFITSDLQAFIYFQF